MHIQERKQEQSNPQKKEGVSPQLTVIVVVAHDNLLNLAVLAHLTPKVLVKGVKVVLQLGSIHLALWVVRRVLVQVW